ncbi:MAG: site-2 protease family protein, partial [Oscillatoriales cyanobacterium]
MLRAILFHIPQNLMLLLDRSAIDQLQPVLAQATGMPIVASENTATIALVLVAVGILGWGFYRARPFGKLGMLAWLQSVVLMSPWLLFFGLFGAGIYLNLVAVLLLLVTSTGLYIYLGRQLRKAAADAVIDSRPASAQIESQSDGNSPANEQRVPAKEIIKIVTSPATNELEIIP